jgi:hypothetical protein
MAIDVCSVEFRNFLAYRPVKTQLYKYPAPLSGKKRVGG